MLRRLLLIPIFLFLIALFPMWHTSAQGRWAAWVYQPLTGQLLQVDPNGSVLLTQRIMPPENHTLPETLYFAHDGLQAAYITEEQDRFVQQLHVLNLETGAVFPSFYINMPDVPLYRDDYFVLTKASFHLDGSLLIYTRMVGGVGWKIDVLEIATGNVLFTLSNKDDIVSPFIPLNPGVIPIVQSVRGDSVTFTIDNGSPITQHSYTWFYRGGILTETVAAPSLQGDSYSLTGDIVNPLPDWRFPAEMELFTYDYQQVNSLHVYETQGQTRYPFFTASDLHFRQVWFAQDGEVLVGEAVIDEIREVWAIIGRDGDELRRLPVAGRDVTGTPDGFLYVTRAGQESTALVHVDTRTLANAGDTVWVERGDWRVLWAGVAQLGGYPTWAQLAEPLQDPSGIPSIQSTPTQLPPFMALRTIGMEAQIYTEDDEYLNLRDAPSTNSNVLAFLESGTQVIIIGGPIDAEGYRWWEIRIGNRTGWVVESLPDVLTLIPPQFIPEKTEEPETDE